MKPKPKRLLVPPLDPGLALSAILLLGFGLVMVTSASVALAEGKGLPILHYFNQQCLYLLLGFLLCWGVSLFPIQFFEKLSPILIIVSIVGLLLLFIPGLGREVNGSTRWLHLGPFSLQVSEFVKLTMILYIASYLKRYPRQVKTEWSGFLKPLSLVAFIGFLLLLEPDFGAAVVIAGTVMGMLFLGGVPFRRFLLLILLILFCFGILSISAPYRLARLTTFLNPWADQFKSGYQLTQSLIAFGRGGIFGTGLGNSIQKLLYLPEPHTDFILAVIGEELGLLGILFLLSIFLIFIYKVFDLGRRGLAMGEPYKGYVAFGIGLWIALQTFINMGVNIGLLPTKGLTLPFISYGRNSLLVCLIALGLLFRIDYELRQKRYKLG